MDSIARNGSRGNAIEKLGAWLMEQNYSAHCRHQIVAYLVAEGTLTGCPELDHEDEAVAEQVYVHALPAVPQTSDEWCDGGAEWTLSDPAELERMSAHEEEWCYPPRRQVSPVELSQLASHGCI
jgi:hypothetical protein